MAFASGMGKDQGHKSMTALGLEKRIHKPCWMNDGKRVNATLGRRNVESINTLPARGTEEMDIVEAMTPSLVNAN